MRNPLRRPVQFSWPPARDPRRAVSRVPMRPWQVRSRRFTLIGFRRQGLDPVEVHEFLDRVADDLATVYAQLSRAQEQNIRIKKSLRHWQSRQAPTAYDLGTRQRPTNQRW